MRPDKRLVCMVVPRAWWITPRSCQDKHPAITVVPRELCLSTGASTCSQPGTRRRGPNKHQPRLPIRRTDPRHRIKRHTIAPNTKHPASRSRTARQNMALVIANIVHPNRHGQAQEQHCFRRNNTRQGNHSQLPRLQIRGHALWHRKGVWN